ncbi:transcriptional regulator, AsnC family [Desulfocicer vacuolatum DSM 3385]|uniref:Transcriptional regulator, AsnC family n=1 Tax=Desulfocicer vacuolatum DSM 3385 TaxID=1121400 RepID=A0A1W2C1V5_9BACT|nr:Lrp/AsnC family transcriptional regulator [Desulfocicer vacuolatum]SMC79076.1 transcriptional regulator, AsnC family [Desulfocicer vacuolatum DSM 3385]
MDHIDFKILKILQTKARIPNVEVAREIGMAPSAVLERIKKLEAQGVIDGYEVRLNPDQFEGSLIAFLHVTLTRNARIKETAMALADMASIQEVHYIAGEDGLMLKVRVADTSALETLLTTRINPMPSVARTKSSIVLSTFKETAKIPLPETYHTTP